MERATFRWLVMLAVGIVMLSTELASASVVEHTVTPASDPSLVDIDVTVTRRADGSVVFTLTVQPATRVYAPRVTARPGATPVEARWLNADAEPLVARIVVSAGDMQTAVISVMRDFGLIGHHYTIVAAAWMP